MKVKVIISHKRAIELLNDYCYQEMHKSFPDCNVFVTIEQEESIEKQQPKLYDVSVVALVKFAREAYNQLKNVEMNKDNEPSLFYTKQFVDKYISSMPKN